MPWHSAVEDADILDEVGVDKIPGWECWTTEVPCVEGECGHECRWTDDDSMEQ